MNPLSRLLSSSIGMKIVMAVSGALLVFFIIVHMIGNLEVFGGQAAINHYGALLRTLPPALWGFRAVMALMVVLHVFAAIRLWFLNRAARSDRYIKQEMQTTTLSARTMILSGIVLGAFVVFHLLHFTVRTVDPAYKHMQDALGRHDVYGMVTDAFMRRGVAGFYLVAMLCLGLHVSHGVASMIHTLGFSHPRYSPALRWLGPIFAVLIVAGFVSVPLAVLAGVVKPLTGRM